MWDSGTSSDRAAGRAAAALLAAVALVWVAEAAATVLVTVEEAVSLAFQDAATARETLFLTDEQIARVADAGGGELSGAMVTRYVATASGEPIGYAYLDTHRVRTLPETLMVVLEPDGRVRRVEVVAFREPLEYIPRDSWYGQFEGERLSDELALKRDIRPVTGATLTARATTEAVRRILAIHEVVGTGGDR
jgi:Na+-translocating ferredoxin:NAD+ oxidoreductase RnfG subunit